MTRLRRVRESGDRGTPGPPETTDQPRPARPVATVNELARVLRAGLDQGSAAVAVASARRLLGVAGAALTDLGAVLSSVGPVPSADVLVEHTGDLLARANPRAALRYRVEGTSTDTTDGDPDPAGTAMIAKALVVAGSPVAVLHVVPPPGRSGEAGVSEYVDLLSTLLELAELDASRRRAESAELRALRAELSPHFLHNALTAISGFIATDPERAEDLLSTFAEFLRAGFRHTTDFSTVAQEIRLVEIYLELERARFGDRFDVSLRIAPEALPVPVPFLTIQPIVENAIRHGLERRAGRGRLRIHVDDRGTEVHVSVEDDGVGTDAGALERAMAGLGSTRHLGILAVDERLRSAYGPAHGLVVATAPQAGTLVTMRVPKHRRGGE